MKGGSRGGGPNTNLSGRRDPAAQKEILYWPAGRSSERDSRTQRKKKTEERIGKRKKRERKRY